MNNFKQISFLVLMMFGWGLSVPAYGEICVVQNDLNQHDMNSFIGNCKHGTLEGVQQAICNILQDNYYEDKVGGLKLLDQIQKALEGEVRYIRAQMKHKYRFDQRTLHKSFMWGAIALGLSIGTVYAYKKWLSPARKEVGIMKNYFDQHGIMEDQWIEERGTCRSSYVGLSVPLNSEINNVTLRALCDKYAPLLQSEKYASNGTLLLTVFGVMAWIGSWQSLNDLSKIDPNRNNQYLLRYQDLLKFVKQLKKGYQAI